MREERPETEARQVAAEAAAGLGQHGSSGEFDPGSERTLAACLTHASRMRKHLSGREEHGRRVRSTYLTGRIMGDTLAKVGIIPHTLVAVEGDEESWPLRACWRGVRGMRPIS